MTTAWVLWALTVLAAGLAGHFTGCTRATLAYNAKLRSHIKELEELRASIPERSVVVEEDDETPVVIVCQGPPVCDLQGDDAVDAAIAGCPWCQRIIVHEDLSETIIEPTRGH